MFKTIILFTFLAIAASINNVNGQKERSFDLGTLEDGTYSNEYFDFNMTFPRNWAAEIDKNQAFVEKGLEVFEDELKKDRIYFDPKDVEMAILVTISKYAMGTAVDFNPNILIMVENVAKVPGIKTGADYLFNVKKLLKYTGAKSKVKGSKFEEHNFGGKTFHSMITKNKLQGIKYKQVFYTTILNDFAFCILCTYKEKDQLEELLTIVNTTQFDN